jgi:ribonuclease HI
VIPVEDIDEKTFIICSSDGSLRQRWLGCGVTVGANQYSRCMSCPGGTPSSSQAEVFAAAAAIQQAVDLFGGQRNRSLVLFTDSQVLELQATGSYQVKTKGMRIAWSSLDKSLAEAQALGWKLYLLRVENAQNGVADFLAGKAVSRKRNETALVPYSTAIPKRGRGAALPWSEWLKLKTDGRGAGPTKANQARTSSSPGRVEEPTSSSSPVKSPARRNSSKGGKCDLVVLTLNGRREKAAAAIAHLAAKPTNDDKDRAIGRLLDGIKEDSGAEPSSQPPATLAADDETRRMVAAVRALTKGKCVSRAMRRVHQEGVFVESGPGDFLRQLEAQIPPGAGEASGLSVEDVARRERVTFAQTELLAIITNKDKDTSPGLEELDYGDLTWMAENIPGFVANLAKVCERIANNEIGLAELRHRLFSVKGVGIAKSNGKLRVLAVGNVLVSLTGALLAKRFTGDVLARYSPTLTLGLACSGVDKGLHATRVALARDEKNIILKLDITNAFNSFNREVLLRHLEQVDDAGGYTPLASLTPYFLARYASDVEMVFTRGGEKTTWRSGKGCVPGDPLGPLFFSVVLSEYLRSKLCSKADLVHSLILSFFDDVTIVGTAAGLGELLDELASSLERETGLRLNIEKCHAWRATELDEAEASIFRDRGITIESPEKGVELLGSAVGSNAFVESFLQREVEGIEKQAHVLLDVLEYGRSSGESDIAAGVYRALGWIIASKFTHHLRQIDSPLVRRFARMVEEIQLTVAATLLGIPKSEFSVETRTRLLLPVRHGGMGLTPSEALVDPARVAGFKATEEFLLGIFVKAGVRVGNDEEEGPLDALAPVEEHISPASTSLTELRDHFPGLREAFAEVRGLEGGEEEGDLQLDEIVESGKGLQRRYADLLHTQRVKAMVETMSDRRRKIFLESVQAPEAGAWLTGPLYARRNRLTDQQFKNAFAIRLGLGLRGCERIEAGKCPLCRQELSEEEVLWHPVSCSVIDRAHRHYVVNEAMRRAIPTLSGRAMSAEKEVRIDDIPLPRKEGVPVSQASIPADPPAPAPKPKGRKGRGRPKGSNLSEKGEKTRVDLVLRGDTGACWVIDLTIGSLSKHDSMNEPKTRQLEKKKRNQYKHFTLDSKFVAFAGDAHGAVGGEGKKMIDSIFPVEVRGKQSKKSLFYWEYSIALCKGNSRMIETYERKAGIHLRAENDVK